MAADGAMGRLVFTAQGLELRDRQPDGWDHMNLPRFKVTVVRRIVVCKRRDCKGTARRQLGQKSEPGADPYVNPRPDWHGPKVFNTDLHEDENRCEVCGAIVRGGSS